MLCALALAACSGGGEVRSAGALQASAHAQRQGVLTYDVSGASVALLASDGSALGVLRVSAPTSDTRQVDIEFADGQQYTDEISRPVEGRFRVPVLETREGFIEADPALASFFAAYDLSFEVQPETGPAHPTTPEEVAGCHDVGFASVCVKCLENSAHPCYYTKVPGGLVAHAYAHCPPKAAHCQYRDVVSKLRTCYAAGSCSQHALGFIECSDPAPDYCGRRGHGP
jgi:hypothetical protein